MAEAQLRTQDVRNVLAISAGRKSSRRPAQFTNFHSAWDHEEESGKLVPLAFHAVNVKIAS